MQPKKYTNPKIALLNVELELKAEKTNAEIRIDNVEVIIIIVIVIVALCAVVGLSVHCGCRVDHLVR